MSNENGVKTAPSLSWADRIAHYGRVSGFPVCMGVGEDGRAFGIWNLQAEIGMVKSTNYRYRVVCVFERRRIDEMEQAA